MRQPRANTPITRIPIPLWERVPSKIALLPSPLAGESGSTERSDGDPGEGFARERAAKGWTPHPPRAFDARHPLPQGKRVRKIRR